MRPSPVYEQGRVHHAGAFPELEDQVTSSWLPGDPSPDRMDALVRAISACDKPRLPQVRIRVFSAGGEKDYSTAAERVMRTYRDRMFG